MLSDFDLTSDDTEPGAVAKADEAHTAIALVFPESADEIPPPSPEPVADTPPEAAPAILWAPQPVPDGPDSILVSRILAERPDVLNAYFVEHIRHDGRQHEGWVKQIGGSDSAEGYARYWYERNGRFEGYNQGQTTAGDNIDIGRLLAERPDVFHAYQRDYLDHKGWKSHEWKEVLGGNSAEDYAKYWFRNHGQHEGYNQRPPAAAAPDLIEPPADTAKRADPVVEPEAEPEAQEEVIVLIGAPVEDPILI